MVGFDEIMRLVRCGQPPARCLSQRRRGLGGGYVLLLALAAFVLPGCSQSDHGAMARPATAAASPDQPDPAVPLRKYNITPGSLPAPFATPSAQNGQRMVARRGAPLTVPKGFRIESYTRGLVTPRVLTFAPNGDLFVVESNPGRVTVLRDTKHTGQPDVREVYVDGLNKPFGLAFYPPGPAPKYVYIGNTDRVVRFSYKNGDLKATGGPESITPLPGNGYHGHWTRRLIFSPDGKKMYVSVGSEGNVDEEEERRAAILEFNPDGTGYRHYAGGLRNPVGIAWNPVNGKLWTCVNERDGLGDDLVPDYATSVVPGGFYGWPYAYVGRNHDPRMPRNPIEDRTIVPDVLLEAHCAALGITFYTGKAFPAEYRNDAFVTLHGSWNRAEPSGYKVVRIRMNKSGEAVGGYEDFAVGWLTSYGRVWGRPVDAVVAPDGSLLISDDGGGAIWRVDYPGADPEKKVKPVKNP
jgi:glucose/arabinose dehydrogenase